MTQRKPREFYVVVGPMNYLAIKSQLKVCLPLLPGDELIKVREVMRKKKARKK